MNQSSGGRGNAAWERFMRGDALGEDVPALIVQSWQRSREAGVDPERPAFRQISDAELQERLAGAATLIELARPHLLWLSAALAPLAHAAYLVDRDGIVLEAVGEAVELRVRARLAPGFDWSEATMGTNGAGTALVLRQPVAVLGGQHFCRSWHDTTCVGAPIIGPDDELLGAIDLTTSVADGHVERLPAVRHVAYTIERELALRHALAQTRASEAAVRARDELLALVSHHMRTPLALIATSVALILDQLAALDAPLETARVQLDRISEACERMEALARNLLDLGRIDAGRASSVSSPCSLRALLREAVTEQATLAQRRGLRLTWRVDEDLIVRCDGELTAHVLRNLIENAIKFSVHGAAIEVRGQRAGGVAHVCVIDRGAGIQPTDLPRIFDRYFQVAGPKRRGVGLGLFIVRSFLEAQGSAIHVDSTPGEGSRFCFELPLEEPPIA